MLGLFRLLVWSLFLLHASSAAAATPRVMVLYFDNNSKDVAYDGLSKGLADMMVTDLAEIPSIQVVEREKLESLLTELKLQRSKYFDAKTAQRIGRGVSAEYAVTGAFLSLEPDLRIDVRVIRVDSGLVVSAASVVGKKDEFFQLQKQLAAQLGNVLSDVLGEKATPKLAARAQENRVGKLSAVAEYGAGLDAQDRGDLEKASKHLQKVVASEPGFTLGKWRYRKIMQALYEAKDRRTSLLSASEEELLAHAEKALQTPPDSPGHLAYRLMLGEYYLRRMDKAIRAGQEESDWKRDLRKFVENQEKLFKEAGHLPWYQHDGSIRLASEDKKLAQEIGLQHVDHFDMRTPVDMMRASAGVLMGQGGDAVYLEFRDVMPLIRCPFKIEPQYGDLAVAWLEAALAHMTKHQSTFKEFIYMRTMRDLGVTLALLGRTEEALARLQEALGRYPKSDDFDRTEELLRRLLKEPPGSRCKLN